MEVQFSPFFIGIVLVMREKNTTFAHEESVLSISAEHCRIEKLAGFQIVTYQADNLCKFLVFNGYVNLYRTLRTEQVIGAGIERVTVRDGRVLRRGQSVSVYRILLW